MTWLPLLSAKPLESFSPEEFKAYVKGLYHKPEPKRAAKKPKPPFRWKITKTGKISVVVNRRPRWISREEIAQIAKESGVPENVVWLKVLDPKAKNPVRLSSVEQEKTYVEWGKR